MTIRGRTIRGNLKLAGLAAAMGLALIAGPIWADIQVEEGSVLEKARSVLDNDYYKISVDMRQRFEFAKQNMLDRSEGITLRTRLGIETKPIAGFSGFAELGNIVSYCQSCYFDLVETPNGKTSIADPRNTDLNRLFLQYENDGDMPLTAIVGRQRIIFDDARFVGNVGWRQHEQTFDAALGRTSFDIEGLEARYAYLWNVKRIFGDPGTNPNYADFHSKSHVFNLSYDLSVKYELAPRIEAFGYLLDLSNSVPSTDVNSSDSYGFRVTGAWPFADGWKLGYIASYARQTNGGNNPIHYNANYVWLSTDLGFEPVGNLELGFELLGSDDGNARFVTPLATAHKFNGFADVFLDNGGPTGLRDFFVSVGPRLPWGMKGKFVYHKFWDDDSGDNLGGEFDAELSKELMYGFSVLGQAAIYDASQHAQSQGRQNIWRATMDIEFKY